MRRLLLLTFAALLASLAVHAATYYGFKIGGVPVTSDNYQNVTGSNIKTGTVVYDPSTMTVTLTNVTIERTGSDNRAIYNESKIGLRVKLVGTNILGAADAAPVRFEQDTYFIVSSGTTTITGGSEGGIYITGGRTIWFEGPGTLIVNAEKKGGIEGSNDNNYVHFLNDLTASIYGGGGDLLDIYSVDFNGYNKFKEITLKGINSSTPNVKNVTTMLFGGKNVVQQPAGAEFNPSSKSIANYDYTNNAFLGDVKGSDIVISDKDVVALLDATNFPDAIFRNFLTQKFSKRHITTGNVEHTIWLNVSNKGISKLKGIEYFTALESLNCSNNSLTTLDVSALTALTTLTCNGNQLTTLDVRHNPNLKLLHCYQNSLYTLNLSNNQEMEDLWVSENNITGTGAAQFVQALPTRTGDMLSFKFINNGMEDKINELTPEQVQTARAKGWNPQRYITGEGWGDYEGVVYVNASNFPDSNFRTVVSGKDTDSNGKLDQDERAAVTELDAQNKGITSLQGIKYFTELTSLDVRQNNLGTLDLSQNTKLSNLSCWDNQLTTLDVSKCTQLQNLLCYENQLQQLDLTPNKALIQLICTDNQLTSLKVATQSFVGSVAAGMERRFQVFNNQLGSDAVDQFIASLDNRPTRKTYYIFTAGSDDQQMTTAQVQQSRAKGWWPMKVVGDQAVEYGGVDEYPITIAGTQVTSDNKNGVTGDGITGTITYDPEANVLTLNNATITTSAINAIRVRGDLPGLNIKLVGNNTITMTANSKIAVLIDNCDGAVIEGPGKLQFNNAGAALYIDSGPGTGDHRMTIRNCEILANDPTTYSPSGTSIQDDQNSANITIENATVHLERGKINSGYDLQLVGCKISKPVGGFVNGGSICAPGDYPYEGEILIEPVSGHGVIGDINGDGTVDVDDMNAVINIMLGKADTTDRADVNGDGTIDVDDMNAIINIMLGKS